MALALKEEVAFLEYSWQHPNKTLEILESTWEKKNKESPKDLVIPYWKAVSILALIRERVDKIRKDNPYDIEFWKVDTETLMVTHRTTGYCMTDRERQNAYVVFDEACHEVLRMLDK